MVEVNSDKQDTESRLTQLEELIRDNRKEMGNYTKIINREKEVREKEKGDRKSSMDRLIESILNTRRIFQYGKRQLRCSKKVRSRQTS